MERAEDYASRLLRTEPLEPVLTWAYVDLFLARTAAVLAVLIFLCATTAILWVLYIGGSE